MPEVLESRAPIVATPRHTSDAQAEAIAQRLAQFQETMALIDAMPNYRAEAGLGPLPDNISEMAYEDREADLL